MSTDRASWNRLEPDVSSYHEPRQATEKVCTEDKTLKQEECITHVPDMSNIALYTNKQQKTHLNVTAGGRQQDLLKLKMY